MSGPSHTAHVSAPRRVADRLIQRLTDVALGWVTPCCLRIPSGSPAFRRARWWSWKGVKESGARLKGKSRNPKSAGVWPPSFSPIRQTSRRKPPEIHDTDWAGRLPGRFRTLEHPIAAIGRVPRRFSMFLGQNRRGKRKGPGFHRGLSL